MADTKRRMCVVEFSRTFVNVVNHVLFPEMDKAPDETHLSTILFPYIKVFLDRHKMELYFLYREERARFQKDLDEKSFKELLELMISDLKGDAYNSEVFSYFCIVISCFAAFSKKVGIDSALKVAARVTFDIIEHFEKDDAIKDDVIDGIKSSLANTAERILSQKMSDIKIEGKE